MILDVKLNLIKINVYLVSILEELKSTLDM
jgi:hypothetical protein